MKKIALWATVAVILFVVIISGEKINQTKPTEDNNKSYSTPAGTNDKQYGNTQSSFTNKYGTATTK